MNEETDAGIDKTPVGINIEWNKKRRGYSPDCGLYVSNEMFASSILSTNVPMWAVVAA